MASEAWWVLVDAKKHRIVKRGGKWRMYCPQRGTDSLISAPNWECVEVLLPTTCPHL